MNDFDKAFDLGMSAGVVLGVALTCVAVMAAEALAAVERDKARRMDRPRPYAAGFGKDVRRFETMAEALAYDDWLKETKRMERQAFDKARCVYCRIRAPIKHSPQ